jgi:hypothetical protein
MPNDLDIAQRSRLGGLLKRLKSGASLGVDDVFASEQVIKTHKQEKTFLHGFDLNVILGLLAFTPSVYVLICPRCISEQQYPQFVKLVQSGLVVPILLSPFEKYPTRIAEFVSVHDHVSYFEFNLWREYSIMQSFSMLDEEQALKSFREMHDVVEDRRNKKIYLNHVHAVYFGLRPFTQSDETFIEVTRRACRDRKLALLTQLNRIGSAVANLRSAQAFNASLHLQRSELELPSGITNGANEARLVSTRLKELAADGLGIRIPTDLPLETYIELAKDYQPRISKTIQNVLMADVNEIPLVEMTKEVSNINREIERIKGLRRYAVLEAFAGLYKNNSLLVGGAILAAAMGLTTGLLGCAAASAAAAGGQIAKKKKWIPDNPGVQRIGRMIARDVQPYTDTLLKGYLGGTAPAVNVLSLQRRIETAAKKKNA